MATTRLKARLEARENVVLELKEEFIRMHGKVAAYISELRGGLKEVQGNLAILSSAERETTEIKVLQAKLTKICRAQRWRLASTRWTPRILGGDQVLSEENRFTQFRW